MDLGKTIKIVFLYLGCWVVGIGGFSILYAQEEIPEEEVPVEEGVEQAQSVGTGSFWRLGFYEWTTLRFQGDHPFYEMTRSRYFEEGNTGLNSTQDNTGLFLDDDVSHNTDASAFSKIAHALPPFSLEYIMPIETEWVKAHSFAMYYTNTWLTDQTAQNDAKSLSQVPLIEMRNHQYLFSYNFFLAFPPGPDQTELYYGIGLAHIESSIRNGIRSHGSNRPQSRDQIDVIDYYQSPQPIFFQRAGLTTSAENFGISLEMYFLGKAPAMGNPFRDDEVRRVMVTPDRPLKKEISLQGLLLRFVWGVYSFWN